MKNKMKARQPNAPCDKQCQQSHGYSLQSGHMNTFLSTSFSNSRKSGWGRASPRAAGPRAAGPRESCALQRLAGTLAPPFDLRVKFYVITCARRITELVSCATPG